MPTSAPVTRLAQVDFYAFDSGTHLIQIYPVEKDAEFVRQLWNKLFIFHYNNDQIKNSL